MAVTTTTREIITATVTPDVLLAAVGITSPARLLRVDFIEDGRIQIEAEVLIPA